MRLLRLPALLLAAMLAAGACSPLFSDDEAAEPLRVGYVTRTGDEVSGTGAVEWIAEQGGFFAIRGDDGRLYHPVNLPPVFARTGTRVRFAARVSVDPGTFAPLVRLERIARV